MSMWRPLFLRCMILDHKLQRMLNDSEIAQLDSERPLHQTAVTLDWPIQREFCLRKSKCHCSVSIFCRHHAKYFPHCQYFCPALEEKPSKEPDHTWTVQVVITDGDSMVVDNIITVMIIALLTIITITIIIDKHY